MVVSNVFLFAIATLHCMLLPNAGSPLRDDRFGIFEKSSIGIEAEEERNRKSGS
jgi:hypothetical protein